MTQICITGLENSPAALTDRLARVMEADPSLLAEVRLDAIDFTPQEAFRFVAKWPKAWSSRIILTQRLRASGLLAKGGCDWDILTWQSWWRDILTLQPLYAADLDWLMIDRLASEAISWQWPTHKQKIFFSLHANLHELPNVLPEFCQSARSHGVGLKVAAPVNGLGEIAQLILHAEHLRAEAWPFLTVVAMGDSGRVWRWSKWAGSVTYFAANAEQRTANGQDTLADVLPYVQRRQRPDLYVLLSQDPQNTMGEKRWNKAFAQRGFYSRYLNVPNFSVPQSTDEIKSWTRQALTCLEKLEVKGASITRPFKTLFPSCVDTESTSINTLRFQNGIWQGLNTDGLAVENLLRDFSQERGRVVIIGGGGAAQAVAERLKQINISAALWRRDNSGALPILDSPETVDALISTWPGEFQNDLIQFLQRQTGLQPKLFIDAQFSVAPEQSPIAQWCGEKAIRYLPGVRWWSYQAAEQDRFWFGTEKNWPENISTFFPRSKSETIRALVIAALSPGKTEILDPAICIDSSVMVDVLEQCGVEVIQEKNSWLIIAPQKLRLPQSTLNFQECATALRFFLALQSRLPRGTVALQAAASLQNRLAKEGQHTWPWQLPTGEALPQSVSLERSSQYASGMILALATQNNTGELILEEPLRSLPYVDLTIQLLQQFGYAVSRDERRVYWQPAQMLNRKIQIDWDASALSYMEIFARWHGFKSASQEFSLLGRQGDSVFPLWLEELWEKGRDTFSLRDHPDLAPSLWAAAILRNRSLRIIDAPHLQAKESNRAEALVKAARALGISASVAADGFYISAEPVSVADSITLDDFNDHRLVMAFSLLSIRYANIRVKNSAAVQKSFPAFLAGTTLFFGGKSMTFSTKLPRLGGVFIIGFRGVGKSTVGKIVAENLGWEFIDADIALEAELGESILSYVEKNGEQSFRELESKWLAYFINQPPSRPFILALGGGIVESASARQLLSAQRNLYLSASTALLWVRLQNQPERLKIGQLDDFKAFSELLRQREPHYLSLASTQIDNNEEESKAAAAIEDWIKVEFWQGSR